MSKESVPNYRSRTFFPRTLYAMLEKAEQDGYDDVVSWQPHGRAFRVHDKESFVATLLPRWFRSTKYTSFQRQLSLYGFKRFRQRAGPDFGAYFHRAFLRGSPELIDNISRIVDKDDRKQANISNEEADFYKMPAVGVVAVARPRPRHISILPAPSRRETNAIPPMLYPAQAAAFPKTEVLPTQVGCVPCGSVRVCSTDTSGLLHSDDSTRTAVATSIDEQGWHSQVVPSLDSTDFPGPVSLEDTTMELPSIRDGLRTQVGFGMDTLWLPARHEQFDMSPNSREGMVSFLDDVALSSSGESQDCLST